jgi:hypothetical protein
LRHGYEWEVRGGIVWWKGSGIEKLFRYGGVEGKLLGVEREVRDEKIRSGVELVEVMRWLGAERFFEGRVVRNGERVKVKGKLKRARVGEEVVVRKVGSVWMVEG